MGSDNVWFQLSFEVSREAVLFSEGPDPLLYHYNYNELNSIIMVIMIDIHECTCVKCAEIATKQLRSSLCTCTY